MTLSQRIQLAEKLGYHAEWVGLQYAAAGQPPRPGCTNPDYLRGYQEGVEILRIEGV